MRRTITIAALLLTVFAGSAMADRHRGGDHRGDRSGYRDNRGGYRDNRRVVVRDNRRHDNYRRDYGRDYGRRVVRRDYRYHDRRPVYVNNGRYIFNGYSRNYVRPYVGVRYYNYRVRPQILVENYENVDGYVWVAGNWSWNGYEWIWTAGHYVADPNWSVSYDGSYDGSYEY